MSGPSPDAPLVLIVDDNALNRKLAREVLHAAGFRTLEAASGAEGVALAEEHRPSVILLDLRLPDMDGTEAARQLADREPTAAIPVVAFSSLVLEEDAAWWLDRGFAGFLQKPIDVQSFPDQVRGYCR